jgi:hypothetical protein
LVQPHYLTLSILYIKRDGAEEEEEEEVYATNVASLRRGP